MIRNVARYAFWSLTCSNLKKYSNLLLKGLRDACYSSLLMLLCEQHICVEITEINVRNLSNGEKKEIPWRPFSPDAYSSCRGENLF